MDPDTFFITSFILLLISFITGIVVLTVGCCCLNREEILMKVFPYIKKSGNHIIIFGFVITKRIFILQWLYMMYAFAWILFIVLFNTFFTFSYKYNPYDGLNCFASYNGSIIELVSEEQAEMEKIAGIMCYGWNLDIGGAIGRAAAILALSWIFSSFVLWVKLHLLHLVKNFNNEVLSKCSNVAFFLFHFIFFLGSLTTLFMLFYLINKISPYQTLDIGLLCVILLSGFTIFPSHRKLKSLAEYCKEAVEDRQGTEGRREKDLELGRVHDHQSQADLLKEMAELECKKALADYYYSIKEEKNSIDEDEMHTIAHAAYSKIATLREATNQVKVTREYYKK